MLYLLLTVPPSIHASPIFAFSVSLPPCYQTVSSCFSFLSLGGGHFAYSYILDRSFFFSHCVVDSQGYIHVTRFFGRGDLFYYWEGGANVFASCPSQSFVTMCIIHYLMLVIIIRLYYFFFAILHPKKFKTLEDVIFLGIE